MCTALSDWPSEPSSELADSIGSDRTPTRPKLQWMGVAIALEWLDGLDCRTLFVTHAYVGSE